MFSVNSVRAKLPRFSFALAATVCSVIFMGAGCGDIRGASSEPSQLSVPNKQAPSFANPQGLAFGGKMQSSVIMDSLRTAIEADTDSQMLISKYKQLGFDWKPEVSDFVAELDADRSSLVGIAYRRDKASPTSTAWLVALFPLNSKTFEHPKYLYLVTYTHSDPSPIVRYWVENGSVQSREELPSDQAFFQSEDSEK